MRDNGLSYEECADLYFTAAQSDEDWESSIKWSIEMLTGESETSKLYKIGGMYRSVSDFDDEYLISRASLFSSLFKDPFGYTPDQISDMTLGQISLVLADNDKPRTDLKDEKMILNLPKNSGTRKMLSGYTKTYRELAENLVSGLSLTSGIKQ